MICSLREARKTQQMENSSFMKTKSLDGMLTGFEFSQSIPLKIALELWKKVRKVDHMLQRKTTSVRAGLIPS
jgi:hypothetical protein